MEEPTDQPTGQPGPDDNEQVEVHDSIGAPFPKWSLFLVGLFGGVYGVAFLAALNVRRLGRPSRDIWLYAGIAAAFTGFTYVLGVQITTGQVPSWFGALGSPWIATRMLGQALGLLFAAFDIARLRASFEAAKTRRNGGPNTLMASILAIGFGFVLTAVVQTFAVIAAGGGAELP